MTDELPQPANDDQFRQWQLDLVEALGYGTDTTNGPRERHLWNVPYDSIAFIEDTNEVVIWEVDGPKDERGLVTAHVNVNGDGLALRPVRYPMPDAFELVTLTTDDSTTHRIALRKAAA